MPELHRVTGLMSGSSLDGVDLAYCEFSRVSGKWNYRIIEAETIPYPDPLKDMLGKAAGWGMERILELDRVLGNHFAGIINDFHSRHRLSPDLIASHGHTLLHNPREGITFQAGHGRTMADRTGITVVCDFRTGDVAQGGQGAPLAPVGDRLLFGEFDACVNLGGFSNISFEDGAGRIAYDIGPANLALNWIAGLVGMELDRDGELARQGMVDDLLLERLNSLEYYSSAPPKSLGREWFTGIFLPLIRESGLAPADLMATVAEHMAVQLSAAIGLSRAKTVLVTGGGALNRALIERLRLHSTADIQLPDIRLVCFKEALIFALLGLLRTLGEINCLASATGGRSDLSAGTIYQPRR
jgi:anhydro-N-acetylmuramic acid kinase